jgi:hypothetical protein
MKSILDQHNLPPQNKPKKLRVKHPQSPNPNLELAKPHFNLASLLHGAWNRGPRSMLGEKKGI